MKTRWNACFRMGVSARIWLLGAAAAGLGCGFSSAELQPVDGETPFRLGWKKVDLARSPFERLQKEPVYKTRRPLHLAVRLGSGADAIISGALDESKGTASGYDTLYLDANNNGDLTDDAVLRLATDLEGDTTAPEIEPVDVTVKYANGARRTLRIKLEMRWPTARASQEALWTVGCFVAQHVEGTVDIGDRKQVLIAIYDSSTDQTESNGCFDDYCVDRLQIDLNGDGQLDGDSEDFPLSKVIAFDGKLWTFEPDSAAQQIKVSPCARTAGKVRFQFNATTNAGVTEGMAELISDRGIGFRQDFGTDATFTVPEANYRVTKGRLTFADRSNNARWAATFFLAAPFAVRAAEETVVSLGLPFKADLTMKGDLKPGGEVCFMPYLTGRAGEVYENIAPAGIRMTPSVKIMDAEQVVASEGRMDYG